MKKFIVLFTAAALLFGLCACTAAQPDDQGEMASQELTWQDYYDLGLRYLSEGNYEEAVIAFTAAIEIDPKQAPAYVGRGDAYVLSGETEKNLTTAKADYETAIGLDETIAEAYLGLADVYVRQGDLEKALEILRQGYESTSNSELLTRFEALESSLSVPESAAPSEIPVEPLMLTEQLVFSNISYTYEDGNEWDPRAVGTMVLRGMVNGPANVCDVRIWTWQEGPFSQEEINGRAAEAVSIWKQAWTFDREERPPFRFQTSHPVFLEDRAAVTHVLLIGLDRSGNAVAYGVIAEEIP